MVENWKMDVVEMKEWHRMNRWGVTTNASMRFIVDKSLEPQETKWESVWRKQDHNGYKGIQQRKDSWHPLSPGRSGFPAVHCLLLEIGSMFRKSLSVIMNNHGLDEVKQHWHKNSIICTRFWVATCVKEYRLWEIKWDMQLNAHKPMAISMRRKIQGNLIQIGLSRQKNCGMNSIGFQP
jgi:hypothetical protein